MREFPVLSKAVAVIFTAPSGNMAVGTGRVEPYGATKSFQGTLPIRNSTRSIWPLSVTSATIGIGP